VTEREAPADLVTDEHPQAILAEVMRTARFPKDKQAEYRRRMAKALLLNLADALTILEIESQKEECDTK